MCRLSPAQLAKLRAALDGARMLAWDLDLIANHWETTIDIPEFIAAWGNSETRPWAAYSIPRGEPVWVLATQPNEPRMTVEQSLAFSLGRTASLTPLNYLAT